MPRGTGGGSIFKRGQLWWCRVYVDGVPVDESSKSDNYEAAKRHLTKMNGRKERGELGGANAKMTVDRVIDHYLDVCKHSVQPDTRQIYEYVFDANIRPFFGKLRADKVTTAHLLEYRKQRTAAGRSASTANRELVILRAALRAAAHATPPMIALASIPRFTLEDERPFARTGFVVDDQFSKVLAELPSHLHPLTVCAYNSAVRVGALKKIAWPQVDFQAGLIRLYKTKNHEPRTIPFLGDMETHLLAAKAHRDEFYADCKWVFSHLGEQIRSFKGSWEAAVKRAGYPDLLFHDFRRSGIRNLKRAGVSDTVAMRISGHKTRAVFDRYNIVDEGDLTDAAAKVKAFRAGQKGLDSDLNSDKNRDSDAPQGIKKKPAGGS